MIVPELIVQDNKSGIYYDISDLTGPIQWTTHLFEQPGKLDFEFINDGTVSFYEGSAVQFRANNKDLFKGFVFTKSFDQEGIQKVTCYDQLRYLKNKDGINFAPKTASEIFSEICKKFQLNYKITNASSYKLPRLVFDNTTLYEMIKYALDKTLIEEDTLYIIRDNFGTLEFINIENLKTNLIIGDDSLASGFNFTSSIDKNVYTQVKLVQDDSKNNTRVSRLKKSDQAIKAWGILQYFEKVDSKLNETQVSQRADAILKYSTSPQYELSINAEGDLRVFAGTGIGVKLSNISEYDIQENLIVTSCQHTFKKDDHVMKLNVKIERNFGEL